MNFNIFNRSLLILKGCEQLGGKLHNTRKWIGATEVFIC